MIISKHRSIVRVFLCVSALLIFSVLSRCAGGGGGSLDYNPTKGKFKLANSWGVGGTWEHVPDGCLWMTFDAAIANSVIACFCDERVGYDPRYIVTFQMTHDARADCEINFYLADSQWASRVIEKRFDDFINRGGNRPFPENIMVLDITEFASYINSKNLYMEVYDRNAGHGGTSNTGTIDSLAVERHDTYDPPDPADKTVYSSDTLPASTIDGGTVYLEVPTKDNIGSPPAGSGIKASPPRAGNLVYSHIAGSSDIEKLKEKMGLYDERKSYNRIIDGHGTGMRPLTEDQWKQMMGRLKIVESLSIKGRAKSYPESLDHTTSAHFPPIGNQGSIGSCASFSTVYYAKTFQEAAEKGWDLSSTIWTGPWPGYPSNNQDKIFSPEFVYYLINNGTDGGSNFPDNVGVLSIIGTSSWQAWPYEGSWPPDDYDWPDEDAWREAPLYRGYIPSVETWGTVYYFYIDDPEYLEIVKTLLANNILVSIIVDADLYFENLTPDDVWNVDNYQPEFSDLDHANTIVGYEHD